jgi:hypothetical protein
LVEKISLTVRQVEVPVSQMRFQPIQRGIVWEQNFLRLKYFIKIPYCSNSVCIRREGNVVSIKAPIVKLFDCMELRNKLLKAVSELIAIACGATNT